MPQLRVAYVAEGHVVSPAAHDRDGERSRAINTHIHTYTKKLVEPKVRTPLERAYKLPISSIIVFSPRASSNLYFLHKGDVYSSSS